MFRNLHRLMFSLLIIGGLNWAVFGLFGVDIGTVFGGQQAIAARIIYVVVGAAAIYEIFTHKYRCGECVAEINAPEHPEGTRGEEPDVQRDE